MSMLKFYNVLNKLVAIELPTKQYQLTKFRLNSISKNKGQDEKWVTEYRYDRNV